MPRRTRHQGNIPGQWYNEDARELASVFDLPHNAFPRAWRSYRNKITVSDVEWLIYQIQLPIEYPYNMWRDGTVQLIRNDSPVWSGMFSKIGLVPQFASQSLMMCTFANPRHHYHHLIEVKTVLSGASDAFNFGVFNLLPLLGDLMSLLSSMSTTRPLFKSGFFFVEFENRIKSVNIK